MIEIGLYVESEEIHGVSRTCPRAYGPRHYRAGTFDFGGTKPSRSETVHRDPAAGLRHLGKTKHRLHASENPQLAAVRPPLANFLATRRRCHSGHGLLPARLGCMVFEVMQTSGDMVSWLAAERAPG
jgi:hypothetical protein